MKLKTRRLEAGRYQIGDRVVIKKPPVIGRQQTTTWRDAVSGKWLGYTLSEAKELLQHQAATAGF